jgi:hypothetical protein
VETIRLGKLDTLTDHNKLELRYVQYLLQDVARSLESSVVHHYLGVSESGSCMS